MKLMMAQDIKLTYMLESKIRGKKELAGSKSPGNGRVKNQKCICKHCKKPAYHEDKDYFSLPENKDERPTWYKE